MLRTTTTSTSILDSFLPELPSDAVTHQDTKTKVFTHAR